MKKKNRAFWTCGVLALVGVLAYAAGILNPVVNETGLAYSKRFVIDLQAAQVNTVSATASYSSTTFSNGTFTTGQVSTGSLTIVSNTNLSSGTALNNITVISTVGALGDSVVVTNLLKPGAYVFKAGRDWNYGATTALTAASLKRALDTVPYFTTSRAGSVLYSTSTSPGSNANSILVSASNTGTLTVANAAFTGGRNPAVITINGYPFQAGRDFNVGAAASNSATNLAAAVNAKAVLSGQVTATPSGASVTLQALKTGTFLNFSLKTSNTAAVTVLHPTMIGGSNAGWVLNGKNITVTAHGYTLALPVLYRLGAGAAAISGLTGETTYYAIPVDANTLKLASSKNNATAGTAIVLASSSTLTAAKTYSLLPLGWNPAATTGFAWQVSNDNVNWSDVSITSITYTVPGSQAWDFGQVNQRYLGLNVTGPTSGGLGLTVNAYGTFSP